MVSCGIKRLWPDFWPSQKSPLSSDHLGPTFLHRLRGVGRVWLILHQSQNAPHQLHPGEGPGQKGSGQLPAWRILRNGVYFQGNGSILQINQFVSVKGKMELKQFSVSSRNLKKYMPPNCTSSLLRGHAVGCPSVGAGGLGIHGGMGEGGGKAAGPRLCISNPVSEGLGNNIPPFPGRAREYG